MIRFAARKVTPASRTDRKFSIIVKIKAVVAILSFVYSGIILPMAPLAAQTFREFEDHKPDVERYRDRANRLNDVDAWTNYVELGIASEFVEWEEDAYEQLREYYNQVEDDESFSDSEKTFEKNLAQAQLNAASLAWQQQAEDYIYQQRGVYRAAAGDVEAGVDQIAEEV